MASTALRLVEEASTDDQHKLEKAIAYLAKGRVSL
jgi:hypothetical protein